MTEDASVCYAYLILCVCDVSSIFVQRFRVEGFVCRLSCFILLVLLSLSFLSALFNSSSSCDDPDSFHMLLVNLPSVFKVPVLYSPLLLSTCCVLSVFVLEFCVHWHSETDFFLNVLIYPQSLH